MEISGIYESGSVGGLENRIINLKSTCEAVPFPDPLSNPHSKELPPSPNPGRRRQVKNLDRFETKIFLSVAGIEKCRSKAKS